MEKWGQEGLLCFVEGRGSEFSAMQCSAVKAISSLGVRSLWSKMMPKKLDPFGLDFGDLYQQIHGHLVPLQNVWVPVKAFAK